MFNFEITKRTDQRLTERMKIHYSQPKGFVGRNICIAINYNDIYYGHIVFGSATKHLQGRNTFLGTDGYNLNCIANNLFFNVNKVDGKYPIRNFTSLIIKNMQELIPKLWKEKYKNDLLALETLVELPRTGELYIKAGWSEVGITKGFTCKRVSGESTDGWGGRRVWNKNRDELRPKKILMIKL